MIALAKKSGIESALRKFSATYLGSSEVTLAEMTLAYTMFPNGGWRPEKPYIIKRIEEKDGHIIFEEKPDKRRVIKDTTSYEIHSCLAEVLDRGTGDKSHANYGLKKFPLGGKTGTAYNFTDAWFIGYSSAVTCGVWAGFDKPQPIYRGAFSNEIALPIWVDIMNATFAEYKPKEIARPKGLKNYNICSSSGLLATEQCFETYKDKTSEETLQRSASYVEMATETQAPKQSCNVHGESGQSFVKVTPGQEWPRAALAVDITSIAPIKMKAPTVIGGEDPYNSVKSNVGLPAVIPDKIDPGSAQNSENPGDPQKPPEDMEVRRADPVRPMDLPAEDSPLRIEPPESLKF